MSELRDFVRAKRDELQARVAPLLARRHELEKNIRDLTAEIEELLPQLEELNSTAKHLGIEHSAAESGAIKPGKDVTIKQGVRLILHHFHDGLNSASLYDNVNRQFFSGNLDRTSFSPQLSRMRKDGEVDLADGAWMLTNHGAVIMGDPSRYKLDLVSGSKENEPSDAGASDGSDAGSSHRSERMLDFDP